jgi:hypothetical protein
MSPDRSLRTDVRNPMLALPGMPQLLELMAALPPETRAAWARVLAGLAADARDRADKAWRTHKAPMAAYWKCVAVLVGHFRRALLATWRQADVDQVRP